MPELVSYLHSRKKRDHLRLEHSSIDRISITEMMYRQLAGKLSAERLSAMYTFYNIISRAASLKLVEVVMNQS
jgi:hypothetical protein